MPNKIDITQQRGLSAKHRSELLGILITENPDLLERWISLENAGAGVDDIWIEAIDFLKARCTFEKMMDLNHAFVDMRVVVGEIGEAKRAEGN